jgi:hypothetical protein
MMVFDVLLGSPLFGDSFVVVIHGFYADRIQAFSFGYGFTSDVLVSDFEIGQISHKLLF